MQPIPDEEITTDHQWSNKKLDEKYFNIKQYSLKDLPPTFIERDLTGYYFYDCHFPENLSWDNCILSNVKFINSSFENRKTPPFSTTQLYDIAKVPENFTDKQFGPFACKLFIFHTKQLEKNIRNLNIDLTTTLCPLKELLYIYLLQKQVILQQVTLEKTEEEWESYFRSCVSSQVARWKKNFNTNNFEKLNLQFFKTTAEELYTLVSSYILSRTICKDTYQTIWGFLGELSFFSHSQYNKAQKIEAAQKVKKQINTFISQRIEKNSEEEEGVEQPLRATTHGILGDIFTCFKTLKECFSKFQEKSLSNSSITI